MMVPVLHDVVEDTDWTLEKLREQGFSEAVLTAVDCATNRSGESYDQFIERVQSNPIAREVKIADLEDNMNIRRIGEIKPKDLERLEKYHKSWCDCLLHWTYSSAVKFSSDSSSITVTACGAY